MKKVLIVNTEFHRKNKIGIEKILQFLQIPFKYGNKNDIPNYDIIYSPVIPINTSIFPNKQFIFGPHFSVFPDTTMLHMINNIYNNSIYIQPSNWASDVWKNLNAENFIPLRTFCFPVDTDKFNDNKLK